NRCEDASVTGGGQVEEGEGFGATDLADDNEVRGGSHRRPDEIPERHGFRGPRVLGVRGRAAQLRNILDDEEAGGRVVDLNGGVKEGIEKIRLARVGGACDEEGEVLR